MFTLPGIAATGPDTPAPAPSKSAPADFALFFEQQLRPEKPAIIWEAQIPRAQQTLPPAATDNPQHLTQTAQRPAEASPAAAAAADAVEPLPESAEASQKPAELQEQPAGQQMRPAPKPPAWSWEDWRWSQKFPNLPIAVPAVSGDAVKPSAESKTFLNLLAVAAPEPEAPAAEPTPPITGPVRDQAQRHGAQKAETARPSQTEALTDTAQQVQQPSQEIKIVSIQSLRTAALPGSWQAPQTGIAPPTAVFSAPVLPANIFPPPDRQGARTGSEVASATITDHPLSEQLQLLLANPVNWQLIHQSDAGFAPRIHPDPAAVRNSLIFAPLNRHPLGVEIQRQLNFYSLKACLQQAQQSLRVQLAPAWLGKMSLQVQRGQEGLQIQISAEYLLTRELLEAQASLLRQQLTDLGLTIAALRIEGGSPTNSFSEEEESRDNPETAWNWPRPPSRGQPDFVLGYSSLPIPLPDPSRALHDMSLLHFVV